MRATKLLVVCAIASCHPTASSERPVPSLASGRGDVGLAAAMRAHYAAQAAKPVPPLALASDGSELALKAVRATVSIEGPLARTELHFTFENPDDRQREGRFRIDLPDGAAVGRFAMKVGGVWRESRVVSRDRGRQVYEGFLHQKIDPALLEQDLGNRFSARVFPIAAREHKELIVGYDQLVAPEQPYTLALAGLPAIPTLSIAIDHDGERTVTERLGEVPEDVVVPIAAGDIAVIADGGELVARLAPDPVASVPAPLARVLVLVDTSASRQPVMATQVALVTELAARLPAETAIAIASYDHEVREHYRGPADGAGHATDALFARGALGASNLGAALAHAASAGMSRVVIVGDGVATLGETDATRLAALVAGSRIERIDAIQIGQALDRGVLGAITRAGRTPGAILDGRDPAHVARALATALPPVRPIRVAGALEVWPKTTAGLAPGAPLFVTGRLRTRSPELAIEVGTTTVRLATRAGEASRVGRAVARAELAELTERSHVAKAPERAVLDTRIEQLALAHHLVSAKTSLIVLETDADEQRTLGPRDGVPRTAGVPGPARDTGEGRAPTIDPASTSQGLTIDRDYLRNIPVPGRTFEAALSAAAGAQSDGVGVTFSGSTSLENAYVSGVNVAYLTPPGRDPLSDYLRANTFAFGMPRRTSRSKTQAGSPYKGELHQVMSALAAGRRDEAFARSLAWHAGSPGDVAALIALGEALEARGAMADAARAYASIVDLYPNRFELVRAAGERLDRLRHLDRELAIEVYRRSLKERPDQLSTSRLLAFALVRAGKAREAFELVLEARTRATGSVREVLLQDARVIGAHLVATGTRRSAIEASLGAPIATVPSLHLVLGWETDANDVDLHVVDRHGNHAYYGARVLASGGRLLDDLTDGYGPEMFVIERPRAFPYAIAVHYFSAGPMGLGMGTVQIIKHDGKGTLDIEDRPFVLQQDGATIPLGHVAR